MMSNNARDYHYQMGILKMAEFYLIINSNTDNNKQIPFYTSSYEKPLL